MVVAGTSDGFLQHQVLSFYQTDVGIFCRNACFHFEVLEMLQWLIRLIMYVNVVLVFIHTREKQVPRIFMVDLVVDQKTKCNLSDAIIQCWCQIVDGRIHKNHINIFASHGCNTDVTASLKGAIDVVFNFGL